MFQCVEHSQPGLNGTLIIVVFFLGCFFVDHLESVPVFCVFVEQKGFLLIYERISLCVQGSDSFGQIVVAESVAAGFHVACAVNMKK